MAEGHRQRVRDRLFSQQVQDTPEYVILEAYLHGIVPRKDMHDLANRLIKEFGSFEQVVDAPLESLMAVDGVGKTIAQKIKLLQVFVAAYLHSKNKSVIALENTEQIGDYLLPYFLGKRNETVYLLCMNASCKVLGCDCMGEGGIAAVSFAFRNVLTTATKYNATRVVLAHNHPCGVAVPSAEDLSVTRRLRRILADAEIDLLDHLIFSENDFVSLRETTHNSPIW